MTYTMVTSIGVSLLTLDEWSLQLGAEEEKLQELTARLVDAIPESHGKFRSDDANYSHTTEAITVKMSGHSSLLDATRKVDLALTSLLYEFSRSDWQ